MPKKVGKKTLTPENENEEKEEGAHKRLLSPPKETERSYKHMKNFDPNQSLSSCQTGWETAGFELSLSNSHPRNVSQEEQVQRTNQSIQFLVPSQSADQRNNISFQNASHSWFETNTNQASWSRQNAVRANEVSNLHWPLGTQSFMSLLRGSSNAYETGIYPPSLQRNLLQEDHIESAYITQQRNRFSQAQASQDQIVGGQSTQNPRICGNSLYDPMYEEMGLPVDPHLRCFLLSNQAGEKGKSSFNP